MKFIMESLWKVSDWATEIQEKGSNGTAGIIDLMVLIMLSLINVAILTLVLVGAIFKSIGMGIKNGILALINFTKDE